MTYQRWQGWGSLALGVDLHGAPALALLTADLPLAAQQPHPVGKYTVVTREPKPLHPTFQPLLVRNM